MIDAVAVTHPMTIAEAEPSLATDAKRKPGIGRSAGAILAVLLILLPATPSAGPGHDAGAPDMRPNDAFAPSIGVCTSLSNAPALKDSGCGYIEEGVRSLLIPDRSDDEFRAQLEAAGESPLPVLACNSFLPESLKSVGPQSRPDEIIAFAETAFRRARKVGVRNVVFGSSGSRNIPDGFDRKEAHRQFVRLLRRMEPVARKHDIVVVLEPLSRGECNFINTVLEGIGIVEEVNLPNIRLLADIYHMLQENEGPESIVAAGQLLRHCHIAESEGRSPPGVSGDDFTPYLEALREINYSGGISIECRWQDLQDELPVAVETLKKQIARVNGKNPEE